MSRNPIPYPTHGMEDQDPCEDSEAFPGQDPYRKVLLGQASDPLFPAHPDPPEVSEGDLQRQALADVPSTEATSKPPRAMLRWLLLVGIAILGLGLLLYPRWR